MDSRNLVQSFEDGTKVWFNGDDGISVFFDDDSCQGWDPGMSSPIPPSPFVSKGAPGSIPGVPVILAPSLDILRTPSSPGMSHDPLRLCEIAAVYRRLLNTAVFDIRVTLDPSSIRKRFLINFPLSTHYRILEAIHLMFFACALSTEPGSQARLDLIYYIREHKLCKEAFSETLKGFEFLDDDSILKMSPKKLPLNFNLSVTALEHLSPKRRLFMF